MAPICRSKPAFSEKRKGRPDSGYDKMKKLIFLFFFVCCPAFGADSAHTIVQKGREFHPGEVTINRGESLTFTNNDDFIHQIYVMSDNFSFDTDEKAPGEDLTETFTKAGTFEVQCHIHPRMKLIVHVK
jgi:plastocyanin